MIDPYTLPDDLPRPADDGAADHLPGRDLPAGLALPSTAGEAVELAALAGRTVVYAYPRTGRPGEPMPADDWDLIPGARGCTPETCGFRDHHAELTEAGAERCPRPLDPGHRVPARARRAAGPSLRDPLRRRLALTRALALPTFEAAGETLLKRLTLILRGGRIERVWYPVFPPDRHAGEVLAWLRSNPA